MQTVGEGLFHADDGYTSSDITDLFSILCTNLRATTLPISEAATFCRHIGDCTDEVLAQVVARMRDFTNGKVITEADVVNMMQNGVFHPILYPEEDEDLDPDTLRQRASGNSPNPDGSDWSSRTVLGPISRSRSEDVPRRSSGIRRNGWRRFGSVVAGSRRRRSKSERGTRSSALGSIKEDRRDSSVSPNPSVFAVTPLRSSVASIDGEPLNSSTIFESPPAPQSISTQINVDNAADRKRYYLQELFKQLVHDHSRMHYRHFKALLLDDLCRQRLPPNPSESLQLGVFQCLDRDGGGYIEFSEFYEAFSNVVSEEGQFIGFNRRDFSDACLNSLVHEVENLARQERETAKNHEMQLKHERMHAKQEKEHAAMVDAENEQLQDEIETLRAQLASQTRYNSAAQLRSDPDADLVARNRELTLLNSRLTEENHELNDTNRRLVHRNDCLQSQVDGLEADKAETLIAHSQLAQLQARVAGYEQQIRSLQDVILSKEQTVRGLEDDAARFDGVLEALQQRLAAEETLAARAQEALVAEQKVSTGLRTENGKLQARDKERVAQLLALESEVDRLQDELQAHAPDKESDEEVTRLKQVVESLRNQCTDLKGQLSEAADSTRKYQLLATKNMQAYENAMARLNDALTSLKSVEAELNEANKLRRSAKVDKNKQTDLEKQIESLSAALKDLRDHLSAAENEVASNIRLNTALTRRNRDLESERSVLARALNLKDEEVKRLNKQARSAAAEKTRLEGLLAESVSDADSTKAKLRETLQLVASTSAQLDDLRLQVSDKSTILTEHFGNLSQINEQHDSQPQHDPFGLYEPASLGSPQQINHQGQFYDVGQQSNEPQAYEALSAGIRHQYASSTGVDDPAWPTSSAEVRHRHGHPSFPSY